MTTENTQEAQQDVSMEDVDRLLQADQEAESGPDEAEEEAPQEEAPAEEAQEEPQPAHDEQPRGDLRVALREERERRRQVEQQAANMAVQQKAMSVYLDQISKQINPQQQPEPQVPDFDSDPAGHLRHQFTVLQQTLQQVTQAQQQSAQQQEQERRYAAAQQAVVNNEGDFAKKHPDYYEAVDFMRGKLRARFSALGVPDEQLDQAIAHDMRQFGMRALQAGANPAEKIYGLAKIDGYKLSQQSDDGAQKLATVAKGAAASRGARSSAPASNGEMTLEQAANLSYKELAKMGDDAWARLMGGA